MKSAGTLLIVDDDEIFREVLSSALGDQGYVVHQATSGKNALEMIAANPGIGLVLSDIRMPEMDGIELLRQIRAKGPLPVILATGFSDAAETKTAHQIGASGFLAKPFEMSELLTLFQSVLSGKTEKNLNTDDDFARIMIDDFVSGKVLKHNIFIRLSKDKYVKIAHEGLDLDIVRVRDYKSRGVKFLYLKREDFREYLSSTLALAKKVSASTGIDQRKKEHFLKHTGNLVVEKVMIEDLDQFAVNAAKEFFETALTVIVEEDELFRALEILNEHSDHVYSHSLGVSLYSIMIARALGWRAAPTTFRVGLCGLFHDIGLKEIDRRIIDMPRPSMGRSERAIYETHVTRSSEILSAAANIPEEVIQAVVQHHEDPAGFGYPRGLKGAEISPLARLLTVADAFC
jgi:putative nucleotidyltransferase with HDIG domain